MPQPNVNALPVTEESPLSSETEGNTYIDQPYKSGMPSLPETSRANQISPPKSQYTGSQGSKATYNPEAYPKFPGGFQYHYTCSGYYSRIKITVVIPSPFAPLSTLQIAVEHNFVEVDKCTVGTSSQKPSQHVLQGSQK